MNCPKCCQPIILGPAGCGCRRPEKDKREQEEAAERGRKLAELIKRAEKPKRELAKFPEGIDFEYKALDEIISQACDFHVDLIQEAVQVARNRASKKVKREHVEEAVKKLRRGL